MCSERLLSEHLVLLLKYEIGLSLPFDGLWEEVGGYNEDRKKETVILGTKIRPCAAGSIFNVKDLREHLLKTGYFTFVFITFVEGPS